MSDTKGKRNLSGLQQYLRWYNVLLALIVMWFLSYYVRLWLAYPTKVYAVWERRELKIYTKQGGVAVTHISGYDNDNRYHSIPLKTPLFLFDVEPAIIPRQEWKRLGIPPGGTVKIWYHRLEATKPCWWKAPLSERKNE